jgi:hypothetical protein
MMRENGYSIAAEPHDILDDSAAVLDQRRRAVLAVASAATNAEDCVLLLEALGLKPSEGVTSVPEPRPGH